MRGIRREDDLFLSILKNLKSDRSKVLVSITYLNLAFAKRREDRQPKVAEHFLNLCNGLAQIILEHQLLIELLKWATIMVALSASTKGSRKMVGLGAGGGSGHQR